VQVSDLDSIEKRLADQEEASMAADFWDDPQRAQQVVRSAGALKDDVRRLKGYQGQLGDLQVALELLDLEVWHYNAHTHACASLCSDLE
jgi:hypothetical protein